MHIKLNMHFIFIKKYIKNFSLFSFIIIKVIFNYMGDSVGFYNEDFL